MKKKYSHIKTGLIIEAEQYEPGIEDGFIDLTTKICCPMRMKETDRPYVVAFDMGFIKPMPVTVDSFIIYHKGHKFVLQAGYFNRIYSEVI